MTAQDSTLQAPAKSGLPAMSLAALGIVFGDIGTSPLYTLKTVLDYTGAHPDAEATLGALSLILWTLFIITTVKYVNFAMRIDNDGEGGIIALMTLLGVKNLHRPAIVFAGLFGAALIYGDGAITPAISVLSALEGMEQIAPSLQTYVLPSPSSSCWPCSPCNRRAPRGSGAPFGPVMLALVRRDGAARHLRHPAASRPSSRRSTHVRVSTSLAGSRAFWCWAAYFCASPAPRRSTPTWAISAPGRSASPGISSSSQPHPQLRRTGRIVIDGAPTEGNIFYTSVPPALLTPLIVLATVATVIASQSIITGAFSMTRQAIQLGWLPRLTIKQTSEEGYGQIYVGAVNWLLMIVTLGLT